MRFNERGWRGRFPLEEVNEHFAEDQIGVYIITKGLNNVDYVGRSDSDIRERFYKSREEGEKYRYYWFKYLTSPRNAFLLECKMYHKYHPPDNTNHPQVPSGTYWRCPEKNCEWGKL